MDRRSWVKAAGVFLLSPLTLFAARKRKGIRIPELLEEWDGEGAELRDKISYGEDGSIGRCVYCCWELEDSHHTEVSTFNGKVVQISLPRERMPTASLEECYAWDRRFLGTS